MREIIDQALGELDLGLVKAAVEGVSRKRQHSRSADYMASTSAERHPNFHVLTDTVHDELTEPMDAVSSTEYWRGVADALAVLEMSLSEYVSLGSAREHFPEGIDIQTDVGDIKL